jgi:hypothetical protein
MSLGQRSVAGQFEFEGRSEHPARSPGLARAPWSFTQMAELLDRELPFAR